MLDVVSGGKDPNEGQDCREDADTQVPEPGELSVSC